MEKIEIPLEVQGMMTSFDWSHLSKVGNIFVATEVVSQRQYGGNTNRQFITMPVDRSVLTVEGHRCYVGAGAIKFLACRNPFVQFKYDKVSPSNRVKVLPPIEVTQKLQSHPNFLLNGKPREYFYEALEACRQNTMGMIKLPPQSGKTSIMMTLAHNLMKHVGNGLLVVSNIAQRDQMARRAIEYGVENVIDYEDYEKGKVGRDKIDYSKNWTVILTPNMISSRIKSGTFLQFANNFQWVIIDECHHVKAVSEQKIFYVCPNLVRAYGFSATPTKKPIPNGIITFNKVDYEDALRLSYLGPIIYEKSTKDMIVQGSTNKTVLINYKYHWDPEDLSVLIMKFNTLGMGPCNMYDFSHLLKLLCLNQRRMDVISDIQSLLVKSGRNTMLNVSRREYGYVMLDKLNRSDTVCWYGLGKVYINSYVMTMLKDFNAKQLPKKLVGDNNYKGIYESKILSGENLHNFYGDKLRSIISTSSVGSEGVSFDKPINSVILSEGKGSNTISTIQRAGRTSGTHTDKISIIVNIYDEGCSTILNKHSSTRSASIKKEYGIAKAYTVDNLVDLNNLIEKIDKGEVL